MSAVRWRTRSDLPLKEEVVKSWLVFLLDMFFFVLGAFGIWALGAAMLWWFQFRF